MTQDLFTVYPLPTRVTYTREIDSDAAGRVWTSNSNLPRERFPARAAPRSGRARGAGRAGVR